MLNGSRRLEKMNGSEVGIVADRWIGVLRSPVCVTGVTRVASQSPYENARRSGGLHTATRSTSPGLPANFVKAVEGSEG